MSEETQTVELDKNLEKIFEQLDGLSLGQAAQLVKAMETRWGVSAAAPAAVVAAAAGADAEAEEIKTKLTEAGAEVELK
jgi:large subunit ribosomal protein L7/L12